MLDYQPLIHKERITHCIRISRHLCFQHCWLRAWKNSWWSQGHRPGKCVCILDGGVGLISLIVTEKGTINYPWMLYLLIVSPCDHMPDMKQPKGERIYFGLRCWNPSWQGSVVGSSIQMLGVCHRVCCISDDGRSREQPGWKQGWAITHKPILPCFPLLPGRFHLLQAIKPPEKLCPWFHNEAVPKSCNRDYLGPSFARPKGLSPPSSLLSPFQERRKTRLKACQHVRIRSWATSLIGPG